MLLTRKENNIMKRYDYTFTTKEGKKTIRVAKGLKGAIKEFNEPFSEVVYVNKNGNVQKVMPVL
jgi:hypothetical protein